MLSFKHNKLAFVAASILAVGSAFASDSEKVSIDIESKLIEEALSDLSKKTDSDIVIATGVDVDLKLSGLRGDYTVQDALAKMLNGTGLTYEITTTGLIVVSNSEEEEQDVNEGVDEEVVVTGSRLRNVAPTSPTVIITREDFEKQGLATAADIVRSLPQNFSSVNTGSSTAFAAQEISALALGTASADLRGMGAEGTLVLVNGRRMAGSAVFDSGQINLQTIPATAIERVEVLLDGASAIYGADAIAGVINFILKENYAGATTKVRHENSAHDANAYSLSQTFGYTWSSGSALLALEYREVDGVNAAKAGYTTQNLTSQGGRDYRSTWVFRGNSPANIYGFGALPDTFDGTEDWDATDLIPISELPPLDTADRETATSSKNKSATLSVRQEITDSISAFADIMYAEDEAATRSSTFQGAFLPVPATNPYNRLGIPVTVGLYAAGLDLSTLNDSSRLNVSAGFNMELPFKDWALNVTGDYGVADSEFGRRSIDFTDLFSEILPNENVFGNNLAQVLTPYIRRVQNQFEPPERDNRSVELSADGSLFRIAGGDVSLALGTQVREEVRTVDELVQGFLIDNEQSLENIAYFFEFSVPLVGADNALPGVQGLLLSVAGRDESYEMTGQFDGTELPASTKEFGQFTPRVGIRWDISDELLIRSSWGQSFRAPNLVDLYNQIEYFPGNPEFNAEYIDDNGNLQSVMWGRGGNSDLQPETSTTVTFGFEWTPEFIDGLLVSVTYTDIDWEDRIDTLRAQDPRLGTINPESLGLIVFDVPTALGGDGDPTTPDAWPTRPVNLASRTSTSMDFFVAYEFDTDVGNFEVDLTAVKTQELSEQLFTFVESQERQGTESGPDEWVVRAHVGWNRDNYGANLYARYSSSYDRFKTVFNPPLQDRVDHYITYDLTGFYEMDNGFKITGGALNLTNQNFPFYENRSANYDPRRVDGRGRMVYMEVSKEFQF